MNIRHIQPMELNKLSANNVSKLMPTTLWNENKPMYLKGLAKHE